MNDSRKQVKTCFRLFLCCYFILLDLLLSCIQMHFFKKVEVFMKKDTIETPTLTTALPVRLRLAPTAGAFNWKSTWSRYIWSYLLSNQRVKKNNALPRIIRTMETTLVLLTFFFFAKTIILSLLYYIVHFSPTPRNSQ